jgi:CheY-like chemotaxis protein
VESGEEAFALSSKDQRFDVVLCDIMMPKMSGIDLHRWLAESYPRLAPRVVFVTGGALIAIATSYLERVPNQRIKKPIDGLALRKQVSDWVTSIQKGDLTK